MGSGPTVAAAQASSHPDRRGPPVQSGASEVGLAPGIDGQLRELATSIIQRYDREKKGRLTRDEWPQGRWGTFDEAKRQRGDFVTVEALVVHLSDLYRQGKLASFTVDAGRYYHALSAQERLPKTYSFKASPVGANGKLYLASENEDVLVLRMGEKFEVLATNTMTDQMFIATPAISGGEIFLRSQNRLYCISEK